MRNAGILSPAQTLRSDLRHRTMCQGCRVPGGRTLFRPISYARSGTRRPCLYSVDKDTITLRYLTLSAHPQGGGPTASATRHYSLAGDALNVSVQGNSLRLQRIR
jgi:hypothetical protein